MRLAHILLSVAVPLSSALVLPDEKVLSELRVEHHVTVSEHAAELTVDENSRDVQDEGTDVDAWWKMVLESGHSAAVDTMLKSLSDIDISSDTKVHITPEEDWDDDDDDDDDEHPHPHPHPRPRRPCPPWELCPSKRTVWELIMESEHTTRLAEMISSDKKLRKHLNSSAVNHTVFAPTDRALADLPPRSHDKRYRKFLRAILRYHVVPDLLTIDEMADMQTLPTMLNESALGTDLPQRIVIGMGRHGVVVNRESGVVAADIMGSNGVIHSIDTPLTPPPSTLTMLDLLPDDFSTFALGLYKTGLASDLDASHRGGGTTFVPTNTAFRRLGRRANAFLFSGAGEPCLRALMQYHLVVNHTLYSDVLYTARGDVKELDADEKRGEQGVLTAHVELPTLLQGRKMAVDVVRRGPRVLMRVNGFEHVVGKDQLARDGVLHVVDRVLVPPKRLDGMQDEDEEMSLQELKERLGGWVNVKESVHAEL